MPLTLLFAQRHDTATLLDARDYHGRLYVCAETSDRILIGQRRDGREATIMQPLVGRRVQLSRDSGNVWIITRKRKWVKFREDYLTRAFAPQSRCEQIVDAAIARRNAPEAKTLRTR